MKNTLGRCIAMYRRAKHRYLDPFVFIHINKTGGSSVEKALKIPFEHKTALEKIHEIGQESWNRKFTFAVVRNPWDKVVSHFHYRVKTNQTNLGDSPIEFAQWVKLTYGEQDTSYYDHKRMFMPQMNWVTDEVGNILVDHIIRFENLSAGFDEVLKKLNRNATLPHEKVSNRGNYQDYYDDETVEIIRNWFERDITEFGYQF